jgi:uncharacterized protein YkwD
MRNCPRTRPSLTRRTVVQATIYTFSVIAPLIGAVQPTYAWTFSNFSYTSNFQKFRLAPLSSGINSGFRLEPLVVPTPTPTKPTPAPTVLPTKRTVEKQVVAAAPSSPMAEQILSLVNQERASRGLSSLTLNEQLSVSAQKYAERMRDQKFFSHTSPDGTTYRMRNEAAGYTNWTWMGENIAYGQTSAAQVMDDWMNSKGHRENILEPKAKELGVGYVGGGTTYWVQEFGAK